MRNIFNSIQLRRPKTNWFNMSHDVKLSLNMGELVPIMVMDCVPGDKVNISTETLVKMAPMVAPMMHHVDVYTHYFFVPNRIMWPNWETFITGSNEPNNPVPVPPTITINEANYTRLMDYLGIPTPLSIDAQESVCAFPFNAYQMIYNEYYRDQDLIPEVWSPLVNGNNVIGTMGNLRNRAWGHDYFTAARPFAQKGPSIDIPLGDVTLKDDLLDTLDPEWLEKDGTASSQGNVVNLIPGGGDPNSIGIQTGPGTYTEPVVYDPKDTLEVTPTTITDLRRAFKLQEWLEKNARAGTRYWESLLAHFGIKSPDSRLQRPEYITGSKSPMVISEVLNTTGTEDLPQGNMSGHGVAATVGRQGTYTALEHGWIIGIMSVMPKTAYQQGIHRSLLRTSRFDYFWSEFEHIGEQEVLNKELYAFQGADGNETFGYNPRYSEYKFMNSRVAGDFRTSLDFWHMGRIFNDPPALNGDFVTADPTKRIFAVTDPNAQSLWAHVYNKVMARRPMAKYGNPSF